MAGFIIDLNLYGPLTNLGLVKQELSSNTEKRVLYIAIERGSNPEGNDVSYIGISQQNNLAARFNGHHKLGGGGQAANFDQMWVGYPYRSKDASTPAGSHDARLKTLEDIMISWFLPPFNDAGIDRKNNQVIGCGAHSSAHIYFHWWTMNENERSRAGIVGFPKQLNYAVNNTQGVSYDHMEAIY